tara:strand:- start:536 stop:841 length:306 start_codon:yes stop_codon:yes gene_type:complete
MGIFEKGKITLINFLSNRTNLTIFQCLLYFIIGHTMGRYLSWTEMGVMFIVMFLIQFITRTKAVADGMIFRQLMIDLDCDANEIAKRMKDEVDKIDKNELN